MGGTRRVLWGVGPTHEQGHLVSDLGWSQGCFWGEGAGDESCKAGAGNLGLITSWLWGCGGLPSSSVSTSVKWGSEQYPSSRTAETQPPMTEWNPGCRWLCPAGSHHSGHLAEGRVRPRARAASGPLHGCSRCLCHPSHRRPAPSLTPVPPCTPSLPSHTLPAKTLGFADLPRLLLCALFKNHCGSSRHTVGVQ